MSRAPIFAVLTVLAGARRRRRFKDFFLYLLLTLVAIIVIFPLWSALTISMLSDTQVASYPPLMAPTSLYFANFGRALEQAPLLRYLFNSVVQIAACHGGPIGDGQPRRLCLRLYRL